MNDSIPLQPMVDVDSSGFWSALDGGHLAMQHCSACGRFQHPPGETCNQCAGALEFQPVIGTGEVFSFIVVRHPTVPGYLEDLPYAVALVDLDDQPGLRLPARLVDIDPADIAIGMSVQVKIVPLAGGDYRVPVFAPATAGDSSS